MGYPALSYGAEHPTPKELASYTQLTVYTARFQTLDSKKKVGILYREDKAMSLYPDLRSKKIAASVPGRGVTDAKDHKYPTRLGIPPSLDILQ